jgi:hypothetical protein
MLTALLRVLKYNRNHEPAGSPKGGQFARGKGGGVIPQTPLGHKRLYHGGQNVDTLSLDKASVMSLFTKGIYLTDSPRVASASSRLEPRLSSDTSEHWLGSPLMKGRWETHLGTTTMMRLSQPG